MGTSDDPMAVVDSQARVFGAKNLRVVDASSFRLLPPGHPESTVCKSCYALFPTYETLHGSKSADCGSCPDVLAEKIAADILAAA